MAGAIHKMAVYLGLVEDEMAYEDGYDSFEEHYAGYEDEETAAPGAARQQAGTVNGGFDADPADARPAPVRQTADLTRITTLHPRTYNEARTIGEHFREGTPVIMNLSEMVDSDAKRLVDFAAGLIFGLRGSGANAWSGGTPSGAIAITPPSTRPSSAATAAARSLTSASGTPPRPSLWSRLTSTRQVTIRPAFLACLPSTWTRWIRSTECTKLAYLTTLAHLLVCNCPMKCQARPGERSAHSAALGAAS